MLETKNIPPWYRQFWPWFLMSLPFTAVIAGVATYWLAARSADGLVEDDYYKQGIAINRTLDRDHAALRAALSGNVRITPSGATLVLHGNLTRMPERLVLRILHPTRAGMDQKVLLTRQANGEYHGACRLPGIGKWHLLLQDEDRVWRLRGEWEGRESSILTPASIE